MRTRSPRAGSRAAVFAMIAATAGLARAQDAGTAPPPSPPAATAEPPASPPVAAEPPVAAPPVAEPPVAEPPGPAPAAPQVAAPPGEAQPVAAVPDAARPVRLLASVGYDYGLNRLLEVEFDDGDSRTLRMNGGFSVAVGAAFLPLGGGRFETRATVGVKTDSIEASNGSVRYLAFPLELMESVNVRPLRLSLGATLLLAPSVKGEEFMGEVDLELKNSLGLLWQAELVLPFRTGRGSLSAGLRYTWQKLEPKGGGAAEDASAVGGIVGVTL